MTDQDPADTATTAIRLLRNGRFAEFEALFAPQFRGLTTAEALGEPWQDMLGALGPVTAVGPPVVEPLPDMVMVKTLVTCERGAFAVLLPVDQAGQLLGLQFAPPEAAHAIPPWQPPTYADPTRFTEHDVIVDGPLPTPGTLTVPHGSQPAPAVALLAGSGPGDRDATMGPNKILKDLAWGLASRGIAVLRFDKVTFTHRQAVADATDFTVVDEYVRPALAAIRLLREHPAVDADRVFVLGHSQGGTLAPRIASAAPGVAGLVVLAGATQPMHHALVRQLRYLATLREPTADPDSEPVVQSVIEQVGLIDSPELSPSTPSHVLPLGVPAPYWLDLRGYDPVTVAAQLDMPMLIGQGGRDYQVTVADDLSGWQNGLADRRDVTIRVYPEDNHLFFPGSGPSTPQEYQPAQHVDEAVVADIAQWITAKAD